MKIGIRGRQTGRVAAGLRQEIASGRVAHGQFLPSVRGLAEQYRVNKRTAERALRALGAQGLVSAEPRRGFRVLARAGDPDRGLPLAYIAHVRQAGESPWDDFHRLLLTAFQQEAARRGWSLLVVGSAEASRGELLKQLASARVCGAILEDFDREMLAELARAGMPAVVVDGLIMDSPVDTVLQDGELGAVAAVRFLLERGHTRVGWLGPDPAGSVQVLDRFAGAAAALAAAGAPLAAELRAVARLGDRPAALRAAGALLDRPERPTAILALWQESAEALVAAARERNLVPARDFEMVGWSTEEHYAAGYVPLFTAGPVAPAVVWRISELAGAAVRCLQLRRADPGMARLQIRVGARLRFDAAGADGFAKAGE